MSNFAFKIQKQNANMFADIVRRYFPEMTIVGGEIDENVNSPRSWAYIPNNACVIVSKEEDYDITWVAEGYEAYNKGIFDILEWERDTESIVLAIEKYTKEEYPEYAYKRLGKNWRSYMQEELLKRTPRFNWIELGKDYEIKVFPNTIQIHDKKSGLTRLMPKDSSGIKKMDKNLIKLASTVHGYCRKNNLI